MAEGVLKQFDYYYGLEAESFNFIQVPRFLFTNEEFKCLKSDSKILYSLMLDRMSLSRKNQWFDEHNRVYIIYPLEEIQDSIGCGHSKCVELLKELSSFGLIERVKRGQGYPDIIYVKDFLHAIKEPSNPDKYLDFRKSEFKTSEEKSDFRKSEFKTSENQNSRLPEIGGQGIRKSEASNTNIINTNINKTEMNYSNPLLLQKPQDNTGDVFEEEDEVAKIKKQINYDKLMSRYSDNKELLNFIVSEMAKMMCSTANRIELASNQYADTDSVREKLSQITFDDIESNLLPALDDKYGQRVKNPEGYMRICLFNLISRRGAVCYTKDIKRSDGKLKSNYGYGRSHYDFDELERELRMK